MTIKMNERLLKVDPNNVCGVGIVKNKKLGFGMYNRSTIQMDLPNNITPEGIDKILKTIAQALENGSKIVDLDAVLNLDGNN